MKRDKFNKLKEILAPIIVIVAILSLIISVSIVNYKIATSGMPDWVKFWLLSR